MSPGVFLLVMFVVLAILPTAEDRERARMMESIWDAQDRDREEVKNKEVKERKS